MGLKYTVRAASCVPYQTVSFGRNLLPGNASIQHYPTAMGETTWGNSKLIFYSGAYIKKGWNLFLLFS